MKRRSRAAKDIGPKVGVEVNNKAPAVRFADAFVNAPIETVWRVLSVLEEWPKWNESVSWIKVNGPVQAGTSFVWKAGSKIVSQLEEVDPPQRIAWSGKIFGIRAIHVWELEKEGEGTRVHTEESFEGIVAWVFRGFARKTLAKALEQSVSALKTEAEARSSLTP